MSALSFAPCLQRICCRGLFSCRSTCSRSLLSLFVLLAISVASRVTPLQAEEAPTKLISAKLSFNHDVRPILSDRCFVCHGPDEASREADLRLDQRATATEWAIVPGDWSESEVIARITSDDPDLRMPPTSSNKAPLTPGEIDKLKQWIAQGAEYEDHWAFVVPTRPALPPARLKAWEANPIDRFVLAQLDEKGWNPSPRADRRTLLRRAAFDLTGLPPTAAQLAEFLKDQSADAWSRAIDRLLASPAYGEHQARHWLDAARYADSNGYQYDLKRDQWAWRDWVINAFNANQSYNDFTIEQLAGDLLPNATEQQRLATGFNRNHPITIEGGVIDEEYRVEYVIDRTVTAGTVWLGLTLGCARCHDHKFDPLSQKEFYELTAFFNQVPEKGMAGFKPQMKIPSPFQVATVDAARAEAAKTKARFRDAFSKWNPDVAEFETTVPVSLDSGWEVKKPKSVVSQHGAKTETLADGSVLVSGKNPDTDIYEIMLPVDNRPIHGIRLTALADPSVENGKVGRSDNGNFVLSEIEVERSTRQTPDAFHPLKLVGAKANYSQPGFPVARAIDGKFGNSGWAVYGSPDHLQGPLTAVFVPERPFPVDEEGQLRVRLRFDSHHRRHQISRFMISVAVAGELAEVLPAIIALETPAAERTTEEQFTIQGFMARRKGPEPVRQAWQQFVGARQQRDELLAEIPETMVMQDRAQSQGAYLLERGEYDKRGEHVKANTPGALPPMPADYPRNRLGFARWLTMPNHPLTARVAVNRFWIQLFGIGLVESPEDFGLQSSPPSHPELLDWLAVQFLESGWDVKALWKTIMLSQTYQQDSSVTPESHARDPENRFLARGPRLRLDAESIRDAALEVSGLLNRTIGGPSVFPYHPQGLWLEINNRPGFSSKYQQDSGEKLYRRSVYTFWKRTVPPPSMAVFDAPSREYCQVRRWRTNTPLQAFVLLHDPQFVEAARALAQRMLTEGGETSAAQIRFGFEVSQGRLPSVEEQQLLLETYREQLAKYRGATDKAQRLLSIGDSPRSAKLAAPEHAAMTSVARLLLNLSEFVTKG
ncbi:MAG: PSD1 and planctomycete cytochrome C domain-containing protein [Pirellulales bacterium]|nr:PSD1 and planctomycete cytochrome C domain-containing protein [Pirellulales bacterium]